MLRDGCWLPPQYAIDYPSLLFEAQTEGETNVALFLSKHLPSKWREVYIANARHQTNLVRFRCGAFEYICDLYSELEAMGEVPYNQTIEDRVVGALGISSRAEQPRDASRMRCWLGATEEFVGTERDKGHFMAHCIGGGLDVNVFSQERRLNRGWSPQGKTYRKMETYCRERPGTFCFSRPIYEDGSSVPRWLEFGIIKDDQALWVELFDN